MCRRALTALALLSALAPMSLTASASAVPRSLARIDSYSEFAPVGDKILVAREGTDDKNVRLFAIPLAGGAARQVFSFDAPSGQSIESVDLAGSPQRATVTIEIHKHGTPDYVSNLVRSFTAPAGGEWSELQPFADLRPASFLADTTQVDEDRVFTLES